MAAAFPAVRDQGEGEGGIAGCDAGCDAALLYRAGAGMQVGPGWRSATAQGLGIGLWRPLGWFGAGRGALEAWNGQ